jgi:hypothetical protein
VDRAKDSGAEIQIKKCVGSSAGRIRTTRRTSWQIHRPFPFFDVACSRWRGAGWTPRFAAPHLFLSRPPANAFSVFHRSSSPQSSLASYKAVGGSSRRRFSRARATTSQNPSGSRFGSSSPGRLVLCRPGACGLANSRSSVAHLRCWWGGGWSGPLSASSRRFWSRICALAPRALLA